MITDKIGNRIRELRSHTGLRQEKFAQKIGMDRTYFASVELSEFFKDIWIQSDLMDDI